MADTTKALVQALARQFLSGETGPNVADKIRELLLESETEPEEFEHVDTVHDDFDHPLDEFDNTDVDDEGHAL